MDLAFAKFQGTGNDFVILDGLNGFSALDWSAIARFLCDRHFGVGADGVLLLERGTKTAFAMRVYNADGSTSAMCGNGLRCLARYLHDRGLVPQGPFGIETGAGVIRPEVLANGQVRVDMGPPRLRRDEIPLALDTADPAGRVVDEPLGFDAGVVLMTAVSMGNPHAVIFVPDLDAVPLAVWGPRIEEDPIFIAGTNVEFVQVVDPTHARMIVWERGSGATLACGTGACATLVAGVLTGRLERDAIIHLPGGPLAVSWAPDDRLWLTGQAEPVYTGEVRLPAELRAQLPATASHALPTT